jgi:protein SCO1/2
VNVSAAETSGVKVIEHTGAQLPLDLPFVDETGQPVTLRKYFAGNRPVVLQLGYYGCPMLCGLISRGLVESVKQVSLTAGKDYELVFVSIDPKETPELAMRKKESYLQEYGRDSAAGWHFLTGTQANIAALAEADGFKYKWIESAGQFAHPPSLTLCMPNGKISRYLSGVRFDPLTLRESLVEASNGKIGNAADEVYLTCFKYDGKQGKYAMAAVGMMRLGGLLMTIIVGTVLARMFLRERKMRAT